MADEEHVRILEQGSEVWNDWRSKHRGAAVDLRDAKLSGANLGGANLSRASLIRADLHEAYLRDANLVEANLRDADLSGAKLIKAGLREANLGKVTLIKADLHGADLLGTDLHEANLRGANLRDVNLRDASLIGADLRDTDLGGANFDGANLRGADLRDAVLDGADLRRADLSDADLGGANLRGTNLHGATLQKADLGGANLRDAILSSTNLHRANLIGANFSGASLAETLFVDLNLSGCKGLESCVHHGPSIIDMRTLGRSGRLPLAFLRGVGLPDALIEYLPSLLGQAIQFYSCFISYSSKDEEFVRRLHADLQDKGVRCWFAPHDMKIGAKILDTLDEAIRLRDKVLLILSEASIASDWVEDEVTKAFAEERQRGGVVLFPVRLDDAVLATDEAWAAKLRAGRHIGDFRAWKDHDAYQKTLERVLRDLKIETAPEAA